MRLLFFTVCCLLGAATARAMTPEEFQKLYNAPQKGAEVCYRLYEAFSQGDGVEVDETRARKWLLAAHRCGKEDTRAEMDKLPWRKSKFKKGIRVAKVDDATARAKGEELVRLLMKWSGPCKNALIGSPKKMTPAELKNVRKLIAEGADLNVAVAPSEFETYTALSIACHHSELSLAKLLIEQGADPNACSMLALNRSLSGDSDVGKPLSKKVVQFLVKNGLDLKMLTDYGWSAAMLVSFQNAVSDIDLLAKAGMDVNVLNSPQECASGALPPKRMNYFVEIGGVRKRHCALFFCARNANDKSVEALLRNGANTHVLDDVDGQALEEVLQEVKKYADKKDGAPHVLSAYRSIYRMLQTASAKQAKK